MRMTLCQQTTVHTQITLSNIRGKTRFKTLRYRKKYLTPLSSSRGIVRFGANTFHSIMECTSFLHNRFEAACAFTYSSVERERSYIGWVLCHALVSLVLLYSLYWLSVMPCLSLTGLTLLVCIGSEHYTLLLHRCGYNTNYQYMLCQTSRFICSMHLPQSYWVLHNARHLCRLVRRMHAFYRE